MALEESKLNSEKGSFAELPQEERPQTPVKQEQEEETVITVLKEVIKAIEAKEAQVAHHLDRIAVALEKIAKGYEKTEAAPVSKPQVPITPTPAPKTPVAPSPAPAPVVQSSFLETTKSAFPKELEDMLMFEDKGNMVTIKPRQFLGSENFAKIASIVRSIGGEYISAGRDSHFRVVKK